MFPARVSGMKMHIFRNQLQRDLPSSSASKDGLQQPPPCILNVAFYLPKLRLFGSVNPVETGWPGLPAHLQTWCCGCGPQIVPGLAQI